jgi:4-amino-4-deoxy-L-arabinose transferase-like glycosyltransferase
MRTTMYAAPVIDPARDRTLAWVIVALALFAVVLIRLSVLYEPYTFLIGDCPYYTQAAISMVVDGDLDLRNQLGGGVATHARQIALGARGEWYPKHPILMPLLSAPLLPLLGMNAFLVFNIAVLIGLGLALYKLCSLTAGRVASALAALATILGSFLILYDYNYSPDLLACLILTLSIIALIRHRAFLGGLLGGLAVFARTSNLFLLPLLALYLAWRARGERSKMLRRLALFGVAAAIPLAAQAGLNTVMFGSPAVSPYMRIIDVDNGEIVLRSHVSDFENPLWEGIRGQLLDRKKGLLRTAPILLAAIPGLFIWLKRRPDQALLCLGVGEFIFLLFSRYRWWPTSHEGNRFLMPTVALAAPAVACLLDWILVRGAILLSGARAGPNDSFPADAEEETVH